MNYVFKFLVIALILVVCFLVFNNRREANNIALNKQNVLAFYDLMFNQANPSEAVKLYVGDRYTQHNPLVKDGKEAFIDYFERMKAAFPGKKVIFKQVFAENDYVILHCLQTWPGDHQYATIDIFKLDKQHKIIEHWDVIQTIPDHSENSNTMF